MAINGLHGLLYTSEPEKLRAMLRDVFGFKSRRCGRRLADLRDAAGGDRRASG